MFLFHMLAFIYFNTQSLCISLFHSLFHSGSLRLQMQAQTVTLTLLDVAL